MIKKVDISVEIASYNNLIEIKYIPSYIEARNQIEVKRAVLKLNAQLLNQNINHFLVSYNKEDGTRVVVDEFANIGDNGTITFDISDELQDMLEGSASYLSLFIEGVALSDLSLSNGLVKIEYEDKLARLAKASLNTISNYKAGDTIVDLSTKSYLHTHSDISLQGDLNINLSHTYNSLLEQENNIEKVLFGESLLSLPNLYHCGDGWKLNLEQYLIKDENGSNKDNYVYIDANGAHIHFEEKFTYKDEDEECEVSESNVRVDVDGTLFEIVTGNKYKVEKKLVSKSGIELDTSLKDISNSHILNIENEELETLRKEQKQLEFNIENIQENLDSNKKQIIGYAISKELKEIDARIKEDMVVANRNTIRFTKLLYEIQERYLKRHRITNYLAGKEISESIITAIHDYPENGANDEDLNDATLDSIEAELSKEIANLLTVGTVWFEGSVDQQTRSSDLEFAVYMHKTKAEIKELIYKHVSNYIDVNVEGISSLLDSSLQPKTSLALVEAKTMDWQIESLTKTNINLNKQLEFLLKEKDKVDKQLEHLDNQAPVHYLKYSDGSLFGFAKTNIDNVFRLTVILDSYENALYLLYKDNKLDRIVDKDNRGILLEYKDNKLSSMVNTNGKKIRYEYDGNKLVRIRYGNNKTSEYYYNEHGYLNKVVSPLGYGHVYTVNNGRIDTIEEFSKVKKIDCNGIEFNQETVISKDTLEYVSKRSVNVVNDYYNRVVSYQLDMEGQIVSVYKNRLDIEGGIGAVQVDSYNKVGKKKSLEISSKKGSKDYLANIGNENESEYYLGEISLGEEELISLNTTRKSKIHTLDKNNPVFELVIENDDLLEIKNSKNKQYVLSGFAKADSGYVARDYIGINEELDIDELEIYLEENLDSYRKFRRYELRVVLEYLNDIKEYYVSYDYRNKDWQYNALGVAIDNKDSLVRIRLIFDYTNNINEALFAYMSFKEALYEYKEYDRDDLLLYSENKDYTQDYEYENKKLVKVIKHKLNKDEQQVYEYDDKGRLIRTITDNLIVRENEYNDKNQVVKSYSYHLDNPSLRIYELETYLSSEGKLEKAVNILGKEVSNIVYDNDSLRLENVNGNRVCYGYNDDNLVSYSIGNSVNNSVYKEGMLVSQKHNGFSYNYGYDSKLRVNSISVDNKKYLDIDYQDVTELNSDNKEVKVKEIVTLEYASDEKYIKEYDDKQRLIKTKYVSNNTEENLLDLTYDNYDEIIMEKDSLVNGEYHYSYDKNYNLVNKSYQDDTLNLSLNYDYDSDEKLVKEIFNLFGLNREKTYTYDSKDRLEKVLLASGVQKDILYDDLNRVKEIRYGDKYKILYHYLTDGDHTTNLVSKEILIKGNVVVSKKEYEYDNLMNISKVYLDNELVLRYEYNELSNLIREDNNKLNKTLRYFYDIGGNIENIKEYKYSLEDNSKLELIKNNVYMYSSEGNKDVLLSYNGLACSYDSVGRPIVYKGNTLQWHNFNMIKYNNTSYSYNSKGYRVSKTHNGVTTRYHYDGNRLLLEDNGNKIIYEYDENSIVGFYYKDVGNYHYLKNLQGDIVGILDDNNVEIVRYEYEGYGRHNIYVLNNGEYVDINSQVSYSEEGLNNKLIAQINPFRYRGYYYDVESELYYLINRYYDPQTGRFISIDSLEYLDQDNLQGLNLYAYCLNNPIMLTDSSGTSAWKDFWNGTGGKILGTTLVVAGAIGLTILTGGAGVALTSALGGGLWASVAGGALGGLISGAIIGGASAIIDQGIHNGYSNIDFGDVIVDAAISAGVGAFMGGAISGIGYSSYRLAIKDGTFFTRDVKRYTYNSVNFMFGKNGSFTWIRLGHKFRLEASLKHGFHMHGLGSAQDRWEPVMKAVGFIGGTIGACISSLNK